MGLAREFSVPRWASAILRLICESPPRTIGLGREEWLEPSRC